LVHGRLEIAFATWERAEPALAAREISRGGIDSQNRQPVSLGGDRHLGGRHVVRPVHLDGVKSRARGSFDSLQQRPFGPKQSHVGGKAGQYGDSFSSMDAHYGWVRGA
jgi:hypothetical protein